MKKNRTFLAVLAITLVLGMTFVGCENGTTGGGGGGGRNTTSATYNGYDDAGNNYTLTITSSVSASVSQNVVYADGEDDTYKLSANILAAAAYSPKAGDTYVLIIITSDGTKLTSTGTVQSVTTSVIKLKNTKQASEFTVNINSAGITAIPDPIPLDSGNKQTAGEMTPGTPIDTFKAWLDAQPANTAATAYEYKVKVSDFGGDYKTSGSLGNALSNNGTKYVKLDLSGSTFTSIGEWAFYSCTGLTSITIPDSVTSIGTVAFNGCTSLTSVTIPDSVTSMGSGVFEGCTSLTSVTIGSGVTAIPVNTFNSCTSLASITIPNNVTSIEQQAFMDCTSLISVTIPSSVTSIGMYAFEDCTSLTSVTFATGSNIAEENFARWVFPEGIGEHDGGDNLKVAYLAASPKAGTYTRPANGTTWTKK